MVYRRMVLRHLQLSTLRAGLVETVDATKARHLAPAGELKQARESYAEKFPKAGEFFDADRRELGKGKRAAVKLELAA
jgi:hypothetical protein